MAVERERKTPPGALRPEPEIDPEGKPVRSIEREETRKLFDQLDIVFEG
jgi:hypothetical protein